MLRVRFFTVPVHSSEPFESEVNQFLASHRVLAIDTQLVPDGARSVWAICVRYTPPDGAAAGVDGGVKKARVEYREVLPEAQFQVFVRLRALRKELAERDGVPPYAIFTNEQLAAMVRAPPRSTAELGLIEGVGGARLERYGEAFLAALGPSDAETDDGATAR